MPNCPTYVLTIKKESELFCKKLLSEPQFKQDGRVIQKINESNTTKKGSNANTMTIGNKRIRPGNTPFFCAIFD